MELATIVGHGLLNLMRGVFTLPEPILYSADYRDLGVDILEDTAAVDVTAGAAARTDFRGTPVRLMHHDSAEHFFYRHYWDLVAKVPYERQYDNNWSTFTVLIPDYIHNFFSADFW